MDDGKLREARRESTSSRRTTVSDSATRKHASIYEINDLYSALQELVSSSPAPELRTRKGMGLNFDSSDSWTSGADSPDVRSRPLQTRKNARVVRSASNIMQRQVSMSRNYAHSLSILSSPFFLHVFIVMFIIIVVIILTILTFLDP